MLVALRAIVFLCMVILPFASSAATKAEKLIPGIPHYFDSFNAGLQPWEPGQNLNIEEVFKNYEYYEIVLDQNGQVLTVNQYVQGIKKNSEKYLMLPDGSLRKK